MATLNVKNFPDELYQRLKARAEAEHRSVAGQIIHLLAQATREAEPLSLLELRGLGKEAWAETDAAEHVRRERDAWES
jgi:plasmid stability protein